MISYKADELRRVRAHIRRGGVIAYPTEFCFGLGCDPYNYKAITEILRLKGRDKKKGLIVIAAKLAQLKRLVLPLDSDVNVYWPGPNTLVVPATPSALYSLTGKSRKIAVRVSAHKGVVQLCNYLGMPLVSTSANRAGFRPAKTYSECRRLFGDKIMLLSGTTNFFKRPSAIIDWESRKILR